MTQILYPVGKKGAIALYFFGAAYYLKEQLKLGDVGGFSDFGQSLTSILNNISPIQGAYAETMEPYRTETATGWENPMFREKVYKGLIALGTAIVTGLSIRYLYKRRGSNNV